MESVNLRMFACDIIENVGILLKLPQTAMTTAQMLLHRVYYTQDYTFERYPLDITAMAALFLASKIEEHPRKARDVIDVTTFVVASKLDKSITLNYSQHERVREELINAERRLLKNLGFNLLSNYPHKILVNYYRGIVHVLDPDENVWKERESQKLLQIAWNYCNDSLRTDAFMRYSREAVACACIHMACEEYRMPFPRSTTGKEWYHLFTKDGTEVEEAIQMIKNLYHSSWPDSQDFRTFLYLAKV